MNPDLPNSQTQFLAAWIFVLAVLVSSLIACTSTVDPNTIQQINNWNQLAWDQRNLALDKAWLYADSAQTVASKVQYSEGLAAAYMRKGIIYRKLGGLDSSLAFFFRALKIREDIDDSVGIAQVHNGLGIIYRKQKLFEQAINMHERAASFFVSNQDTVEWAKSLQNLALVHRSAKDHPSAIQAYSQSLELFQAIQYEQGIGDIFNNLGAFWYFQDSLKMAQDYFHKSLPFLSIAGDMIGEIDVQSNLGVISVLQFQPRIAIDSFFLPAQGLAESLQTLEKKAYVLTNLSWAYEELGRLDSALAYQILYGEIMEELNQNSQLSTEILQRLTYVEKARKEEIRANRNQIWSILTTGLCLIGLIGFLAIVYRYRLKIARQLQTQQKERLSTLIQEQKMRSFRDLLSGQLHERERLAEQLHNRLGNLLAGIKLGVQALISSSPREENQRQSKLLEQISEQVDLSCERLSSISQDLDSDQLKKFGLTSELKKQLETLNDSGLIQASIDMVGLKTRLPIQWEITTYDILIELINNVLKHAQASELLIQLIKDSDELRIMVEDNGIGFDPEKLPQSKGFGLSYLNTTISKLNGTIRIDSNPLRGTIFFVQVPLDSMSFSPSHP